MKNKKILIIGIISLFIILGILILVLANTSKSSYKELAEYTPEGEISDDEMRKTIICLYFKNEETNSLIAEARCIDVKNLNNDPYSYLINLLMAGPENEKLKSIIPKGTKVNSCTLKRNTLYVDLSKEFIENASSGIDNESMIVYSIVNTLTELNEVSGVKFLIDGKENLEFKDKQINFNNIFVKND